MTNIDEVLDVMVDGERSEQSGSFVYLGSRVTNGANCADEVRLGTAVGMVVMVKLTKMWKY